MSLTSKLLLVNEKVVETRDNHEETNTFMLKEPYGFCHYLLYQVLQLQIDQIRPCRPCSNYPVTEEILDPDGDFPSRRS